MTLAPDLIHPLQPIRSLADVETYEGARPLEDRIPATVYELFERSADLWGDRTALTFLASPDAEPSARLTYGDLFADITRAANVFLKTGGQGVGVAYLLPSLLETQVCLWAAETIGYAVPLNPLLKTEQLLDLVAASGAAILLCCGPEVSPDIWNKALSLQTQTPGLTLICLRPPADAVGPHILDLAAETEQASSAALDQALDRNPHRMVACFHTGGTTGSPKLVAQTHRNQLAAALGAAVMLGLDPDDVLTNGMPLFHVGGAVASSLAPFMVGTQMIMLSAAGLRNPDMVRGFWRIVERYQVTVLAAVPTALSAILAVPVDGRLDSIRFGITGSAATPRAVAERFQTVTGRRLHEILGMTETGGVTAVDPTGQVPTLGSVGLRLPYTQLVVRELTPDGRPGAPCPAGQAGVLTVSGPHVSAGYRHAQGDDGVFSEGVVNTGDLACADSDGKVRIVGRAKDLIIRSGHNIDPAMIENVLSAHPDVVLAAAVGQPDAYAGELPVCYVALKPQAAATSEDLLAFAQAHVAERPAWPKAIYVVSEIPLTAVGKIFKPALRTDATERAVRSVLAPLAGDLPIALSVQTAGSRGLAVIVDLRDRPDVAVEAVRATLAEFTFESRILSDD